MKTREIIIKEIFTLIILNILSKQKIDSSFIFRKIFLNQIGEIFDETHLINEMTERGLIKNEGYFSENSSFVKNISITEKGDIFYKENIGNLEIDKQHFSDEKYFMKAHLYLGKKK